jgi:tRNA A37 threonylcarbamoyladenosine synthetase subunit TsaC/SUA5/YrdC
MTADLGGDGISVGIRVPRHPALLRLLRQTGPLATSSANPSGVPTPATVQEIEALFGQAVAVYLDGGPAGGAASTVVGLTGPAPVLLREGGVPFAHILEALAG